MTTRPKTEKPHRTRTRPFLHPALRALLKREDHRPRLHRLLDALFPHDTLHVGGHPYMYRWYVWGYAPTEGDPDATMICATCKVEVHDVPLLDGTVEWAHTAPDGWEMDEHHAPVPISAPRSGWRWHDHGVGAFRIHCTTASDDSRAFHDHPWDFASIIVRGAYREKRPETLLYDDWPTEPDKITWCPEPDCEGTDVSSRVFRAPALNVKRATDLHVLEVVDGPVWSLFFTRPKVRSWGFAGPFGWLPWRTFDAEFPERDAFTVQDGQVYTGAVTHHQWLPEDQHHLARTVTLSPWGEDVMDGPERLHRSLSLPIVEDPSLEPGTIEFRHDDGTVVGRITDVGEPGQRFDMPAPFGDGFPL